jgi:hypothetical protein
MARMRGSLYQTFVDSPRLRWVGSDRAWPATSSRPDSPMITQFGAVAKYPGRPSHLWDFRHIAEVVARRP